MDPSVERKKGALGLNPSISIFWQRCPAKGPSFALQLGPTALPFPALATELAEKTVLSRDC